MNSETPPLVAATERSARERLVLWCALTAVRASLLVSPRPAALLLRRVFAASGERLAQRLERHAPDGVLTLLDERYGDDPDLLLDVVLPATGAGPFPLLVWMHGGGFVGGSKDELLGYFKLIAGHGYAVVAPRYSLAPEHHYPTPLRQLMRALEFVQKNAVRLSVDPRGIALGGDSAGAHLASQLAALVTTPGYAGTVGVAPTIQAEQLQALVLAWGPYDLRLVDEATSSAGRLFVQVVLRAYSGPRHPLSDPFFSTWSIVANVSPRFPPALVTVGNADPLRAHSERLVEALRGQGVEIETLFFPASRRPPLGHEYQFELDTEAGQMFLERLLDFLRGRLQEKAGDKDRNP